MLSLSLLVFLLPSWFMKRLLTYIYFLFLLIFLPLCISGQMPGKVTKIKIRHADRLTSGKDIGPNVEKLIGNVVLIHDSTYLHCDSAYFDKESNSFDGFGNVWIKVSDTVNIYSEILDYEGNTRIAELKYNVRLISKESVLTTAHLFYNRNTQIAYYLNGGRIVDSVNVLTSRKAHFYTNMDYVYFKDSVVLLNPDYVMHADTMKYETDTEIAYFFGPTTINSDENLIYCEKGWYSTLDNQSVLQNNAYILSAEQKIEGDSMFYDRNRNFGKAFMHVRLTDTIQDMLATGGYGEFDNEYNHAFITERAMAVMIDEEDSLFIHGDSLWLYYQTDHTAERMKIYNHCKFYRTDLQGKCDSLVYEFADSTIYLYKEPVLWSENNQLSADTIYFALEQNQLDTVVLQDQAMIISLDDSVFQTYNQIKGKQMVGFFRNGEMRKMKVFGNAEFVYYLREDDESLIGINVALASDMLIFMEDNKISTFTIINNPDAHLYPHNEIGKDKQSLEGFRWHIESRPLNKEDIFKKGDKQSAIMERAPIEK